MQSDGIVMGPAPAIPHGTSAVFAMTTAVAPAACAFWTFSAKAQTPRSISATLPLIAAAFVNGGVHPFVVEGSPAPTPSSARTRFPVTPVWVSGGPNAAAPAAHSPGTGLLMISVGTGTVCVEHEFGVRTV